MQQPTRTRIAFADDHNLVRQAIVTMINTLPDYEVVLEAANGKELVDALAQGVEVEIAVVDINMPVMNGYQTISTITDTYPGIRTLAISLDKDEDTVMGSVRSGAHGFIPKDAQIRDFKTALDSLRDTGFYESPLKYDVLVTRGEPRTPFERQREAILAQISEREKELILLICDPAELTYPQIADRMNLSLHGVDSHRRNLFERFNIKSKPGLVAFAYHWRIVEVKR